MELLLRAGKAFLIVLVASVAAQDYAAWDRALNAHVSPGMKDNIGLSIVDYGAMAACADFTAFIVSLSTVNLDALSEFEWKALLINAYNAFAIHMVISNACRYGPQQQCLGPVQSIGDIGGAPGTVWSMPAGNIGKQSYTLQQIEDLLSSPPAPFQADPRIHGCINCASVSCPNLRSEAYRASLLEAQLDQQMGMLVMNPQKGFSLDQSGNVMTLSEIFDWKRAEFEHSSQSIPAFVSRYIPEQDRAHVLSSAAQIGFFPWDRNLNGEAPCACQSVFT